MTSDPAQYISGRTVQEQMNSLIDYVDTRAAEVATDAIASDVAQVHQDMLDADADASAAAASAAAAAGTLANAVKKTGEASQSIAGDVAVAGALSGGSVSSSGNVDGASIGSGTTPVTAGDLTAYGNVSLDDTTLQGNVSVADPSALINLTGAGSVTVPAPSGNTDAATKKYVDDALDNYAPMVRTTGDVNISGIKVMTAYPLRNQPVQPQDNTGWHKIGSWNAASSTANQTGIFMVRFKQDTLSAGLLMVDIRATIANLEWMAKTSGVGADLVILARNTTSGVADLYVYGYRLDIELVAPLMRATSKALIPFTPEANPDTVYTEPVVGDDYDVVVKI